MGNKLSYQPLIKYWESYINSTDDPDLRGFAKYLLLKDSNIKVSLEEEQFLGKTKDNGAIQKDGPYLTPEVAELIFRLSKFIRLYGKPILKEMELSSMDEFVILAYLFEKGQMPKKELIHQNLIEFTTGIDMLRRMVKSNLLDEKVNPKDKRQKLISLSKNGKSCLFQIFEKFQTITDVLADLEKSERENLLHTLNRLNHFHTSLMEKE